MTRDVASTATSAGPYRWVLYLCFPAPKRVHVYFCERGGSSRRSSGCHIGRRALRGDALRPSSSLA